MKKLLVLLIGIITAFVLLQGCAPSCYRACERQVNRCIHYSETIRECEQRCKTEKWNDAERDCRMGYCDNMIEECIYHHGSFN